MLREHPEGRWGTVDQMWDDLMKHPDFQSEGEFVKSNVEKALAFLTKPGSETWSRKPAKKLARKSVKIRTG
jgi:hypothetical protein